MTMPKDPVKAEATRKKMSESAIKRCTPKWREEMRKSTRHHMEDPNNREKISNSLKKYFGDPKNLKKNVNSVLKYYCEHPEAKEKLSIIRKKYYEDNPEVKRTIGEDVKKRYEKIEERIKMRDIAKSNWEDPKWVENYYIGVYKQGFWYGHPTINKDLHKRYCEVFEEVKPRARSFFDYKCIKCGKLENKTSHHVHHIFYEKKTCCWIDDNEEYWTNLGIKSHKKDYYIGDNPNYFALLCDKCHGETGGKYENRKKSADELKKLIDEKFNGKSYYTEEEMVDNGYRKTTKTKWESSKYI